MHWGPAQRHEQQKCDCDKASEASILQLENGKSMAGFDSVSQYILGQLIVEVVESEVEESHELLAVTSLHELWRGSGGIH